MDLKNLITDKDREILHELKKLIPSIKNRWFSMGRDMDKLMKLLANFGEVNSDKP